MSVEVVQEHTFEGCALVLALLDVSELLTDYWRDSPDRLSARCGIPR